MLVDEVYKLKLNYYLFKYNHVFQIFEPNATFTIIFKIFDLIYIKGEYQKNFGK